MDPLTEFYFDCLFSLNDHSSIPDNGKGLTIIMTNNLVTSRKVMELITKKVVDGTAEIILRGILILHFLVCCSEKQEQFKTEILSMRCLALFQEIVKIPYAGVKKQAFEKLSVWLTIYSSPNLSTEEKSIWFELKRIIKSNRTAIEGRLAYIEDDDNTSSCMNQNLCIICMDQSKIYACIPCGHKIICENCYTNYEDQFSLCPVCRKNVERFCKIYD